MRAQLLTCIRRLTLLSLCLTGSLLSAAESSPASGEAPALPAAAAKAAQLKQLEKQAGDAAAEVAKQGSPVTDAQLAERIVREEKILSVRKELSQVLAKTDGRSVDEVAADKQMSDELSKATSAEEREAIIARFRAYRRVAARVSSAAATETNNN